MHNGAYLTPKNSQPKNEYLTVIKKREKIKFVIIKIQFYFAANIEHSHKFQHILFCIYDFIFCVFISSFLYFSSGFLLLFMKDKSFEIVRKFLTILWKVLSAMEDNSTDVPLVSRFWICNINMLNRL